MPRSRSSFRPILSKDVTAAMPSLVSNNILASSSKSAIAKRARRHTVGEVRAPSAVKGTTAEWQLNRRRQAICSAYRTHRRPPAAGHFRLCSQLHYQVPNHRESEFSRSAYSPMSPLPLPPLAGPPAPPAAASSAAAPAPPRAAMMENYSVSTSILRLSEQASSTQKLQD